MTLVDAHRAARRDSPVLPVRIFPVGLSRSNPGREAQFGRRTETPSSCQDGPLAYGGGRSPARLLWVVPTAFRYRLDHVLGHNPLPSRPRTLTEQALWKPVIEQISTFKPASK